MIETLIGTYILSALACIGFFFYFLSERDKLSALDVMQTLCVALAPAINTVVLLLVLWELMDLKNVIIWRRKKK